MPSGSAGLAPGSCQLALAQLQLPLPLLERLGQRVELLRPLVELELAFVQLSAGPPALPAPAVLAVSLAADRLGQLLLAGRDFLDATAE